MALTVHRHLALEPFSCGIVFLDGVNVGFWGGPAREWNLLKIYRPEGDHLFLNFTAGTTFVPAVSPEEDHPRGLYDPGEHAEYLRKGRFLVESLNQTGTTALAPSVDDLRLGIDALRELERRAKFPFVATNLVSRPGGQPLFKTYVEVGDAGLPVLILGLAAPPRPGMELPGVEVRPPAEALRAVFRAIPDRPRLVVVLSSLPRSEWDGLWDEFPQVNFALGDDQAKKPRLPFVWQAGPHQFLADPSVEAMALIDLQVRQPVTGFFSPHGAASLKGGGREGFRLDLEAAEAELKDQPEPARRSELEVKIREWKRLLSIPIERQPHLSVCWSAVPRVSADYAAPANPLTELATRYFEEAGEQAHGKPAQLDRPAAGDEEPPAYRWVQRAEVHSGLGQFARAIACYTRALERGPEQKMWIGRALAYLDSGDTARAIDDAIRAIDTNPHGLDMMRAEKTNGTYQTLPDLIRAFDANPRIYATTTAPLGRLADLFTARIEREPDDWRSYYCRGALRVARREWPQALEDYSRAIRLRPDEARFYLLRGEVNGDLGRWEQAVADHTEATRLRPTDGDAWRALARGLEKLERWEEIVVALTKAIELQPKDEQLRLERARAYLRAKRWKEAVADLSSYLASRGEDWEVLIERGDCHFDLREFQRAIDDYSKAEEIAEQESGFGKRSPYLWYNRGMAHAELGQWRAAEKDFSRYLASRGENWKVLIERGDCHLNLGEFQRAIDDYSRAEEIAEQESGFGKRSPYLWYNRGTAHAELGQWRAAEKDFDKASERLPEDPLRAYDLAMVRLASSRDERAYRQTCQELLKRFGKGEYIDWFYLVLRACSLFPDPTVNPADRVKLAEQALSGDVDSLKHIELLVTTLYRAGRYEDADRRLSEVDESHLRRKGSIRIRLFRAMTRKRLGQTDSAREWLARAIWRIERDEARRKQGSGHLDWYDREALHWLRREAEQLILSDPRGQSTVLAAAQEKDLIAIKELGGRFEVDEQRPARPVVSISFNPDLGDEGIGDEDLACVRGFTDLRTLDLRWTRVTDAGLAHLKELKQLRDLDLSRTAVSSQGIAKLKEALPKTRVVRD
jgi:tetratricopeptide (TPR) repeat protein